MPLFSIKLRIFLKITYNNALFDVYRIILTKKEQLNIYTFLMKQTFYSLILVFSLVLTTQNTFAQDEALRGMTQEEYTLAKTAEVEDLDNDTYVKIGEGDYVLDRYEMKQPYFITGDSGIKKRLDIYKMLDRESMGELGLVVYFTNTEANETFNLVIPNMATKGDVWNMYFDDIHQHDREEGDVALKMSYVLSKEVAYLMQKSSGVDMSAMDQDNSDYDFCFAPDALVSMADGSQKPISEVKVGDMVLSLQQGVSQPVRVEGIDIHQKSEIVLSKVLMFPVEEVIASLEGAQVSGAVELVATANHPVATAEGKKALGELQPGDVLFSYDAQTGREVEYEVYFVAPAYDKVQRVYNLDVEGETYLVNDIAVLEK